MYHSFRGIHSEKLTLSPGDHIKCIYSDASCYTLGRIYKVYEHKDFSLVIETNGEPYIGYAAKWEHVMVDEGDINDWF